MDFIKIDHDRKNFSEHIVNTLRTKFYIKKTDGNYQKYEND